MNVINGWGAWNPEEKIPFDWNEDDTTYPWAEAKKNLTIPEVAFLRQKKIADLLSVIEKKEKENQRKIEKMTLTERAEYEKNLISWKEEVEERIAKIQSPKAYIPEEYLANLLITTPPEPEKK